MNKVLDWFQRENRTTFRFQREAWNAYLAGSNGLIHASTGSGKTLAAFLGPVIEALSEQFSASLDSLAFETNKLSPKAQSTATTSLGKRKRRSTKSELVVLWVTPLRALAADTEASLKDACSALGLNWGVERRTSDTSSSLKSKQLTALPEVLITTPESLSLLLSRPDFYDKCSKLRSIIVDEWHELMGTKRGVQTELALARLRRLQPMARTWGLSATLGNTHEALQTLVGVGADQTSTIIQGKASRRISIDTLIPNVLERFPWAGHLGSQMTAQAADAVRQSKSCLVFTNTRSQCEYWYRALLAAMPELAGQMAIHHGSIDQKLRSWIEEKLKQGTLRCVVCTSSLELGVDFPVVDRVIQVGSPKGCARLVQRAGRSNHRPGESSSITFVPTNSWELVEIAALRNALDAGHIESRVPIREPLDVLAQHVVTVALGGGFDSEELYREVRTTNAYSELSQETWQWVMDFAERGGSTLNAYPDFKKIKSVEGRFVVEDRKIASLHRMSIGTIVSDSAMEVRYLKGKALGTVEETFISRLKPGDIFTLAGKTLRLVNIQDNTAWVKRASGPVTSVPRWMGGRMPLSSELSNALREQLEQGLGGVYEGRVMRAVRPLVQLQLAWSTLPAEDELLIEQWQNKDGHYLFVYPFEGRLVHEGLAALWALRMSRIRPISFELAMNDYGFLLVSPTLPPLSEAVMSGLLSPENVNADLLSTLNASEMTKRQFREVARIAGLVSQGMPGQRKRARHIQASSNLFYEVFQEYDPDNLLLRQSKKEVLDRQLEASRLTAALQRLSECRLLTMTLERPSPLAFPLIVDRLRDRVSSESFGDRVKRLQMALEKNASDSSQVQSS